MEQFATAREAKEYLVGRIVAQAGRDGVSLTEVEHKMLYFSETDWTLPGIMQVNSEFEENYEEDEYEEKISGLVRSIREGEGDNKTWEEAVGRLRRGDHYLLVLIDHHSQHPTSRPRGDTLKLIVTACVVVAVFLAMMFVLDTLVPNGPASKALSLLTFVALLAVASYVVKRILQ